MAEKKAAKPRRAVRRKRPRSSTRAAGARANARVRVEPASVNVAQPVVPETPRLHLQPEHVDRGAANARVEAERIHVQAQAARVEPARANVQLTRTGRVPMKPGNHALRPWLVAGAIAVLGTVALVAARRPSRQSEEIAALDAMPVTAPDFVTKPARADVATIVQSTPPAPASSSVSAVAAAKPNVVAAPPKPRPPTEPEHPAVVAAAPVAAAEKPPAFAPAASPVAAPAPAPAPPAATETIAEVSEPVAISGCLERDDDGFVLKKTSGADAPTSRSWKSGFLKKRTANIELVDASGSLRLQRFVGQRVTATGTLSNREMRPRSVKSLSASCN